MKIILTALPTPKAHTNNLKIVDNRSDDNTINHFEKRDDSYYHALIEGIIAQMHEE
jgi:hypothetical protein